MVRNQKLILAGSLIAMLARALGAFALLLSSYAALAAGGTPFVVILDPGHGGEDAGATQKLGRRRIAEKDITLAIALAARRILHQQGIPSVLTRDSDTFVSLDRRPEIANLTAEGARSAVFVSIHANSSEEHNSAGIETYVFNAASNEASSRLADLENGKRFGQSHGQSHGTLNLIVADLESTANFSDSVRLACAVQQSAASLARRNRGIRQALFYVLMQTHMPSILFEPGFLSNPKELAMLSKPAYQQQVAQALVSGVLHWAYQFNVPTRRTTAFLSGIAKPHCQIH